LLASGFGNGCTQKPPPPPPPVASAEPPPPPPPLPGPYYAQKGAWDLYLPPTFKAHDGHYDLIVHFHGLPSLEERAAKQTSINAAVVAVNHGAWAGTYEDPYRDPAALDRILAFAAAEIASSGRADGATLGRLALSAWSAGAGSVAAILGIKGNAERIDSILLEDGLFTSYSDVKRKVLNNGPLERFVKFAEQAQRGEKLFVISHSAVPTYGYPSMIETTTQLLKDLAYERKEMDVDAFTTMHQTSECHNGSFHLMGFTGTGVQAHMDHVQKMGEISWPYLRERWEGPQKNVAAGSGGSSNITAATRR
jgi:hypothetical protein